MAQDWFAANAPQQAAAPKQDWFAANAPAQPQQQPMSLIQRARAYVDRLSTPVDDPNSGAVSNAVSRFGAGVIANTAGVVNHPYEAAKGFVKSITPDDGGAGIAERLLGPAGPMAVHMVQGFVKDPAFAAGGLTGGALLGEAAAPAVRAGVAKVAAVPEAVRSTIAGPNLDKPIPGEAVTPRQQYAIAKDQGVNLDAAQATGSPALTLAKKATDNSLGGHSAFKANADANLNALQVHSESLLDDASPTAMSREDFGYAAKKALQDDLTAKQDQAGQMYDELSKSAGPTQPPVKGIVSQAKQIVAENGGYYEKHPDMLTGAARRAWQIVNNLADSGATAPPKATPAPEIVSDWQTVAKPKATSPVPVRPADTWSDLHMLRTDLMDLTRSPEIAGNRPEGWLKQMTGAVDDAMSKGALDLTRGDYQKWRDANDLYTQIKSTYDNPTNPLYHVIRQPDGLTVANQLANMKPAIARQFADAAPDLVPQLQRQAIDRMLRPSGNDVPDLQNLPTRFKNAQKEQMNGIFEQRPDLVRKLEDLSRTSRMVYSTDNPSGTATKNQAVGESTAMGASVPAAITAAATGHPILGAAALAPIAKFAVQRLVAGKLVNPGFVDALTAPPKPTAISPAISTGIRAGTTAGAAASGPARWMALGAAKLADHIGRLGDSAGISQGDVDALAKTPAGKQLLIQASDLEPGSAAMRNLVKQIKALQQ